MLKRTFRTVSLILALAMVFSILTCAPFAVSAAEADNEAVASAESPFGTLSGGRYTLESNTYQLPADFAAEGYLYVPSGVNATIDLNGHTIDRGQTEASSTGYVILNEGVLTITDSGNGSGRITGGYAEQGGAVCNSGNLTLGGGTLSGNLASEYGGAVYNTGVFVFNGGAVRGNSAGNKGGGIYTLAPVQMGGSPVVADNANGNLWLASHNVIQIDSPLTDGASVDVGADNMPGTVISDYSGSDNASAFTFAYGATPAKAVEGEIAPDVSADVYVSSWTELKDYINNNSHNNTTIALSQDITSSGGDSDMITVSDKNFTIDLCGHTVNRKRSSSNTDGHAIWTTGTSNLTVRDSYGGGVITGGNATNGGALNIDLNATLNLYNVTLLDNKATYGGGVLVRGTFNAFGAVIKNNKATDNGGGICVNTGTANLTACLLDNNTAGDSGAVFVNSNATAFNALYSAFTNNKSTSYGGGAIATYAEASLEGCIVAGNTAHTRGGGIWSNNSLTLTNTVIANNTASQSGGAVFNSGTLDFNDSVLRGNTCGEWGGGIYLPDGSGVVLNLSGGKIENNTCVNNGGGVHVSGSATMNISGSIVIRNNRKNANDTITANNTRLGDGAFATKTGELSPNSEIAINANDYNNPLVKSITEADLAYFTLDDAGAEDFTLAKAYRDGCLYAEKSEKATVNTWAALQSEVNSASEDGTKTITLSDNVTATSSQSRIRISGAKRIILDLNGKTLDRNRDSKDRDGHVIEVFGTLTVKDSAGGGKITGGWANNGGGINIGENGKVTLESGSVYRNKGDEGGGVHVKDGGTFTMTGGSVSSNEASKHGGGIYVEEGGVIKLSNAKINQNTSTDDGGAIFMRTQQSTTFSNCEFNGNYSHDYGGAIFVNDRITLTINNNTVINDNFSDDDGGGIYIYRGTVKMTDGTISGNTTRCDGGAVKATGTTSFIAENVKIQNNTAQTEEGGAIKNHGTTSLKNCLITGNSSVKEGGGLYNDADSDSAGEMTIDSCVIAGNTTTGGGDKSNGGGIYNHEKLTIKGTTTIGACTVDGVSYPGNNAEKQGGGIYASDGKGSQDVKLEGKLLMEGNTAGQGNDLYLAEDKKLHLTAKIDGTRIGFVDMEKPGDMTVNYSDHYTITNPDSFFGTDDAAIPVVWNDARTEASLKSNWSELQEEIDNANTGATITLDKNYTAGSKDKQLTIPSGKFLEIDLNGNTLNRNLISKEGSGSVIYVLGTLELRDSSAEKTGTVTGGFTKYSGGGIDVAPTGTLVVYGGNITGNQSADYGGGIYSEGKLTILGGTVTDNTAQTGGGICVKYAKEFHASNATISGNTATNDGGGIYLFESTVDTSLSNCTIKNNTSLDYGGGMYVEEDGHTLTIGNNTVIDKNNSSDDGAGIHLRKGTINMTGGSVSGNISKYDGGGVKVSSDATFIANNVNIKNNTASTEEGGGIKNAGKTTLTGCTISGNTSQARGGGIYNDASGSSPGEMTLNSCTIKENSSMSDGGGIFNDEDLTINGGTISSNKSGAYGGGVFINDGDGAENLKIRGKVVIKDNSAELFANDLYIEDKRLTVTGALTGSEIHVDMESGTGVLTYDYTKYNKSGGTAIAPSTYFATAKGYDIGLDNDGEVELSSGWAALKKQIEEYTGSTPIKLTKDYAAKPSDDRIKIPAGKDITIDLNGFTLNRNCLSIKSDGHVFEVYGKLTLTDSSTAKTGTITGGRSANGGGIYINDKATLVMKGGTVSGNRATTGGGIYVNNGGTFTLQGGAVKDNIAESAGGVFVNDSGTLDLQGGTVTSNTATQNGGGIVSKGTFSVKGAPVVKGSTATKYGADIYLTSGKKLTVDGALTNGAKLGIAISDNTGTFTSGYGANNTAKPSEYFVSTQGYTVYSENGEAALKIDNFGETDYESPFISRKDQVNSDPETLSSVNWLAGVSGENYLNEINMVGSHDSSMNNVQETGNPLAPLGVIGMAGADYTSFISYFLPLVGKAYAKTQISYIDQQLQGGARQLDLRLNDRYKKKVASLGWDYRDDGENLWVCHGKSGGGTYFALDSEDDRLSFSQILDWCKDFLSKHPTETIILDLRAETEQKEHTGNIYLRARKILEESLLKENPATHEYYLYKEPGSDDYFAPYTHMPQLKDCRGKIVIQPDYREFVERVGGYTLGSFSDQYDSYFDDLDFTQLANDMVQQVNTEYDRLNGDGSVKLPVDGDTRCDNLWYWELNCTGQAQGTIKNYTFWGEEPYKMAADVNPAVAGEGKAFDPNNTGQYIGWVRFDSFEPQYAEAVWRTNFSDSLQYYTVTVESALNNPNYPAQSFKVLKGTNITIPGNIYKKLDENKNLGGWKAKGATIDTTYAAGDSFKVTEDVTFTANWLEDGQIPVRIEWKDGDNADGLRDSSVQLNVNAEGGANTLTLSANQDWKGIVTVSGSVTSIVPNWNRIVVTGENPLGQDTGGQYRYSLMLDSGNGYVLTFTHTPQTKTSVAGMTVWDDEGNGDKRPGSVTVRLLKNGSDTDISATVTAANDWQFDFNDLARYENGEEIKYTITEDDVEGYASIVEGFTVTNSYVINDDGILEAIGAIEWDDGDNSAGARPESVTLHLLNNGGEVASQEVSAGELGLWSFNFGRIPSDDRANYTITADEVEGYTATVNNFDSPAFLVTYALNVEESDKTPAELKDAPEALDLTCTGEAQTLIQEGTASGGKLMYALGTDDTNAPGSGYSQMLPSGTDAGNYFVWYYVKGDALHTDTEPQCLTATIKRKYFTGHSLTLDGDIGVNFYVDLTAEEAANATVSFTWMKNGVEKTATVDLKNAVRYGKGYKAACYVSASDMNADITATLTIDGVTLDVTDTYSVARYAEVILNDSQFAESFIALENENGRNGEQRLSDLRALVSEMLVYGDNAKVYFDNNVYALEPAPVANIPETGYTETDLPDGVSFDGATLSLRSKTTLSLFFVKEDGAPDITLSMDGKTEGVDYELAHDGNEYVIRIRNIAAPDLGDSFTVRVNGTGTVTYSPMTYCYKALASPDEKLINTVKALYNYMLAAKTFFDLGETHYETDETEKLEP